MICHFKYSRPKFDKFRLFLLTCGVWNHITKKKKLFYLYVFWGVWSGNNSKYQIWSFKMQSFLWGHVGVWLSEHINVPSQEQSTLNHSVMLWSKKADSFQSPDIHTHKNTHTPDPLEKNYFLPSDFFSPWRILMTALSFWGPWEA